MVLIEVVTLLALLQYWYFVLLVGRARGKYGLQAPAVTGNQMFERYYRVQMNTMEQLILFLPSLWLAARYWPQAYVAATGALFLLARFLYLFANLKNPEKRIAAFAMTVSVSLSLIVAAAVGMLRNAGSF